MGGPLLGVPMRRIAILRSIWTASHFRKPQLAAHNHGSPDAREAFSASWGVAGVRAAHMEKAHFGGFSIEQYALSD